MITAAKTVVIVEDEWLLRVTAAEELQKHGFRVLETSNSDEALRILGEHNRTAQVLFTDVHMPGAMNGLELAHHTHKNWPWISILIASGHARIFEHKMPKGSRFFRKPYELAEVLDHIKGLFARHSCPRLSSRRES